jgi:hypothetical protein
MNPDERVKALVQEIMLYLEDPQQYDRSGLLAFTEKALLQLDEGALGDLLAELYQAAPRETEP